MALMNLSDLSDEDLRTNFPQIWMNKMYERQNEQDNSGKTNIFIDQDNSKFYMQKYGSNKATRYNLINANKLISRPQLDEDTHLNADRMISNWGALDDESIFDKTNNNWDEIRSFIQAVTRKINYFTDYLVKLGPYLDELAKEKDVDLSQIIADGVDGYYKKSEVDGKLKYLQQQINNLNNAVEYKPDSSSLNSVFPPSYTGDKQVDINDEIQDANIENKIDSLKQNLEKEKD